MSSSTTPLAAQAIALPAAPASTRARARRPFHAVMALLMAAVVVYGFSRTVGPNLLHPDGPRPLLLHVHALVFCAWLGLFVVQSVLPAAGRVALHRRLGLFGAWLGACVPIVGLATAIVMYRFHLAHDPPPAASPAGLSIPLNDMLCFATAFGLAMTWRRRPDFHRRLMLVAMACLTVAAWARFPGWLVPAPWWYLYVDGLVAIGALRDLVVERRIHQVYLVALPSLAATQGLAMWLALAEPTPWVAALKTLVG